MLFLQEKGLICLRPLPSITAASLGEKGGKRQTLAFCLKRNQWNKLILRRLQWHCNPSFRGRFYTLNKGAKAGRRRDWRMGGWVHASWGRGGRVGEQTGHNPLGIGEDIHDSVTVGQQWVVAANWMLRSPFFWHSWAACVHTEQEEEEKVV